MPFTKCICCFIFFMLYGGYDCCLNEAIDVNVFCYASNFKCVQSSYKLQQSYLIGTFSCHANDLFEDALIPVLLWSSNVS